VEQGGIRLKISTGLVRYRPALPISRFSTNNFSAFDRLLFSRACKMNQQIHNSYYYCYSFKEI
jgi:hypothetical protein